ncbi:MAG: hypothetical protein ABSH16_03650 [Sedimentisphaerales bacterium]
MKKRVAGKHLDRLTALDNPKLQCFVADAGGKSLSSKVPTAYGNDPNN